MKTVVVSDSHCHIKLAETDEIILPEQRKSSSTEFVEENRSDRLTDNIQVKLSNMVMCGTHPNRDWELISHVYNKEVHLDRFIDLPAKTVVERVQKEELHEEHESLFSLFENNNIMHSSGQLMEERNNVKVITGFGVHPWYVPEQNLSNDSPNYNISEMESNIDSRDVVLTQNTNIGSSRNITRELSSLESLLTQLEHKLIEHPYAIVGEIGLDKLRGPPQQVQQEAFVAQLALAAKYKRPVSIHCVREYGLLLSLLKEFTSHVSHKHTKRKAVNNISHNALHNAPPIKIKVKEEAKKVEDVVVVLNVKEEERSVTESGLTLEEGLQEQEELVEWPQSIIIHAFTGSADMVESLLRLSTSRSRCNIYFGIGANTSLRAKKFVSHTLPLLLQRHQQHPCILLESDMFYHLHESKQKDKEQQQELAHLQTLSLTPLLKLSTSQKEALYWQQLVNTMLPLEKSNLSSIEQTFMRVFHSVLHL